jgi:hypothetical protein
MGVRYPQPPYQSNRGVLTMPNGKSIKETRLKKYNSKEQRRKELASKKIAKDIAREITGSEHIDVKRKHIPRPMVDFIERNVRAKFKKRPKFYVYHPKKGRRFKPKKQVGGWDGASITCYNIDDGKINETIIVIPKSHLKDKRLKENVLVHELTETLVGQHMIHPKKKRARRSIDSFEHGTFAMAYEKKHLDKHKMTRRQMSELAKKLWNEEMTKKAEK